MFLNSLAHVKAKPYHKASLTCIRYKKKKKRQKKSARFLSSNQKNQSKQPPPYLSIRLHYCHPAIMSPRMLAETCGFRHFPIYLIRESKKLLLKTKAEASLDKQEKRYFLQFSAGEKGKKYL